MNEVEKDIAGSTSTEWRDDEKNLELVKEINPAIARVPFSKQVQGDVFF